MAKTVNYDLSTQDLSWLKQLSDEIWQANESESRANLSGHTWKERYYTEKRVMTEDEWKRLKELILAHELPCTPGGGVFGFGFSLTVFSHPSFPGIMPEIAICVTGNHLPHIENPGHGENWGKIWETFEPFTHSARNRELLGYYGFEPPRERSYYEY